MSIQIMIDLVKSIQNKYQNNTQAFIQNQKIYIQTIKKEQLTNQKFERLLYMLNMALKVNSGNIESKKANIKIGQVLVDQIVKPHLDKKQTDKSKLYNKNM